MFSFNLEEAKRSGVYIGGTSGSGKTNLAYQLAEQLIQAGVVVFVFDPSQAWVQKSSIPNFVEVSKLPQTMNFAPDQSIIFDISRLYVEEQRKVVADFCKALFTFQVNQPYSKRREYFIFFEESQIYLQQSSMRSRAASEVMRLITVGRNFKIRYGLITQFPSTVDKLPVKMTKQRYFGYTDEKNDKDYIESFLGRELVEELKTLKIGEFFYNSGKIIERIQTPEFKTDRQPAALPVSLEEPTHNGDEEGAGLKGLVIFVGIILTIIFLWYVYTHTSTKYVNMIPLPFLKYLSPKFFSLFYSG